MVYSVFEYFMITLLVQGASVLSFFLILMLHNPKRAAVEFCLLFFEYFMMTHLCGCNMQALLHNTVTTKGVCAFLFFILMLLKRFYPVRKGLLVK